MTFNSLIAHRSLPTATKEQHVPLTRDERRLDRAIRLVGELRAWRNAREHPVERWTFSDDHQQPVELRLGDFWPRAATPAHLTGRGEIPAGWAGDPVEIELWLGGEGLVRLSTGLQTGLNAMHHRFPVATEASGGETLTIDATVSPKGMFGSNVAHPAIEHAMLVVPQYEAWSLERDLAMLIEAYQQLHAAGQEVAPFLLDIADAANVAWTEAWPTSVDVSVTRYVELWDKPLGSGILTVPASFRPEALDVSPPAQELWSLPAQPRPLEPLPESALAGIARARQAIADGLTRLKQDYPPIGRLTVTGHAHIDLAWLWPVAETRRKNVRTFSTVLNLMDRYQDFTFNQSSAQAYVWMAEDDPTVLDQITQRVKEGRWEPVGGSWVEPDCQVTGGEAFVRQLFYGQRAFEALFGTRHTVAWLPDVFGFSGGIPQLLRGAGLTGFFTIKLNWNEATPFPYDLFTWEGIDGSQVTAHMFFNPGHGYNGNIVPLDTLGTWQSYKGKRIFPESLLAFGWGDGGGGPTEKMLENYARIRDFPGLPRLAMGRIDDFYASLPQDSLPKWIGELYLEYHRGTLTTQAAVKQLNRQAEHRLVEAEAFGAIASLTGFTYPHDELESAWKTLLLNQFHDILPGSSIHEVYQDTLPMLQQVVTTATTARDGALRHMAGNTAEGRILVANSTLAPRPLTAMFTSGDAASAVDATDTPLPTQATPDGLLVHAPGRLVPGLGWHVIRIGSESVTASDIASPVRAAMNGAGVTIENDQLRVAIGTDGTIHRLTDKSAGREALADRGNQIWAYVDKPRTYDAWDIEESYEETGEELPAPDSITIIESGPLRASVRVERKWRDSTITQTYRLFTESRRLDIETYIDWHERMVLLKARFPFAVRTHEATFETMYGAMRRATHRNTPFDAARFEVSGHRFADMSEPGYGVALLNNGKYGHSAHDNVLTLSLVRGPLYPDPFADEGEHHFTYSLYPHQGDWTESDVVNEAIALNSPLIQVGAADLMEDGEGFVQTSGLPLALGAMKPAEDGRGIILRLYEPHGARGTATLRFAQRVASATSTNLLEDATPNDPEELALDGDTLSLPFRPFQVRTLRVEFDADRTP
jgi:alpha-mannosidase